MDDVTEKFAAVIVVSGGHELWPATVVSYIEIVDARLGWTC